MRLQRRPRDHRRQGPRKVSGNRRSNPVRRRRSGADRFAEQAPRVASVTVAVATVAFTAALVAEATGGRLAAGSPDAVFAGVSIDSRTTAAGALFVAIQGDRFDGHEFVAKALSQGASGLMVSQPVEAPPGAVVVAVPDTLQACRIWRGKSGAGRARPWLRLRAAPEETSTKELTADCSPRSTARFPQQGQPQQPHRVTALAHRALGWL